jgi:hypothetical protein
VTVYGLIRTLPDIPTVRDRSRAMAMLDAVLSPEWEYRYFSFDSQWSPGVEVASMRDGSGNDYSIVFSSAGVFARGFDHESPMTPYRATPLALWPGLFETVPGVFQTFAAEPAFVDPEGTARATVCFWREAADSVWRCGEVEIDDAVREDADGADWLFAVLAAGTAEAYLAFAQEYYELTPDLPAIQHVYDLKPLTESIVSSLNPEASLVDFAQDIAAIGYPS